MPKGFQTDRADVLTALYGYFITEESGPYVTVFDLKRKASLLLSTSYISLLLESLHKEGWVLGSDDSNDNDTYSLNEEGVLEAERVITGRGLSLDQFELDFRRQFNTGLIVDTDHPDLHEAKKALTDLQSHLREDNDVGDLTPEDREMAINEVTELAETLSKSRIRTSYLWNKANEVLMWIAEKGGAATVGELAKSALRHIHHFISVFFN